MYTRKAQATDAAPSEWYRNSSFACQYRVLHFNITCVQTSRSRMVASAVSYQLPICYYSQKTQCPSLKVNHDGAHKSVAYLVKVDPQLPFLLNDISDLLPDLQSVWEG
jgi:hypothetical protein